MYRKITYYLLFALSLLLITNVQAQNEERPRLRNFAPSDYQARNQNWMISQSADGNIQVANSAGILTFNGLSWQQRTLPEQPIVRSVAVGPDGKVYAGAYGEFGYFPAEAEQSQDYVSLSKHLPAAERTEEIWNILFHEDQVIFQSFGSLFVYDGERVDTVQPPGVILFLRKGKNDLFVPVLDKGIYRWQPGQPFRFIKGTEALAGFRIRGIVDRQNDILIATEDAGLYRWQNGQLSAWNIPSAPLLAEQQINHFQALRNGDFVVGTILGGIYILDQNGRTRYHYDRSNGLQNNTILALYEDRAGNLWAGLDRGIGLLIFSDPLRYFSASQQAIGAVYTAAIFKDRFYLGTNQGLFQKPLHSSQSFSLVAGTQGQVWELLEIDGQLLCGHNNGTFRIERDRALLISDITGGWQTIPIPKQKNLLLQATYTGLICLAKDEQQNWYFRNQLPGLASPVKQMVWIDSLQLLAAHPSQGLYRIRLSEDLSRVEEVELIDSAAGLPPTQRFVIHPFPEGILVHANTQNWLYQSSVFQPIDSFRQRPIRAGAQVVAGQGVEWFEVLSDHLWFHRSDTSIQLPLRLAQDYPKVLSLRESEYLFCLEEGYAQMDQPLALTPKETASPSIRLACFQDGNWQPISVKMDILNKLSAAQNHLRFRFAHPIFDRQPRFRYRLLGGFNPKWSEWHAQGEREYTHLNAGSYLFELETESTGQQLQLAFEIAPAWYQSKWAYLVYMLLVMGILTLMYRWHRWRLKRQERALEIKRKRELQQERIKQRNKQLKNDVIRKSKELANSTINLVRKNEILLHIKQELKQAGKRVSSGLSPRDFQKLDHLIDQHLSSEQDWKIFESNFNEVHEAFFKKLKKEHPDLSPGDLKIAAYLRMNLSSKEIAPLLSISLRGVENKRYRLRKKLGLDNDANLVDYLISY